MNLIEIRSQKHWFNKQEDHLHSYRIIFVYFISRIFKSLKTCLVHGNSYSFQVLFLVEYVFLGLVQIWQGNSYCRSKGIVLVRIFIFLFHFHMLQEFKLQFMISKSKQCIREGNQYIERRVSLLKRKDIAIVWKLSIHDLLEKGKKGIEIINWLELSKGRIKKFRTEICTSQVHVNQVQYYLL